MSSFICEHCYSEILDSRDGYVTGCPHYLMVMERLSKEIAVVAKKMSDTIDVELLEMALRELPSGMPPTHP